MGQLIGNPLWSRNVDIKLKQNQNSSVDLLKSFIGLIDLNLRVLFHFKRSSHIATYRLTRQQNKNKPCGNKKNVMVLNKRYKKREE